MSHRGRNSNVQTVQIWKNDRWQELTDLRLDDVFSTVGDTLWKKSPSVLGFTGTAGNREDLSHDVVVSGPSAVQLAKVKLFVVLDAPDENPVPLDLGTSFNGLIPPATGVSVDNSRLFARILVGVSRGDGSSWSTQEFIANWSYGGGGAANARGIDETTNTGGTNVVVATVDGGSPAQARLTFAQSATASAPRYYVELDLTLAIPVP